MFLQSFRKKIMLCGLAILMALVAIQQVYSLPSVNLFDQQAQKHSFVSNAKIWCLACKANIEKICNQYVYPCYKQYIYPCFVRGFNYVKSYYMKSHKAGDQNTTLNLQQPSQRTTPQTLSYVAWREANGSRQTTHQASQPVARQEASQQDTISRQTIRQSSQSVTARPLTFSAWQEACNALPSYSRNAEPSANTAVTVKMIKTELSSFYEHMNSALQNGNEWIQADIPSRNFFNRAIDNVFEPYVQRVILPTDSYVAFHGDFHGDVHALNDFIQTWKDQQCIDDNFKITRPDFYIVFLGDYTDRGWYGVEVIYALLRLKNANPDKVFMVRGNHEDALLNEDYGFNAELRRKFENDADDLALQIHRMYNYLPLALYLGSPTYKYDQQSNLYYLHIDYIQCCHGGIELGYNPTTLLSNGLTGQSAPFGSMYQKVKWLHQQAEYENIKSHVACCADLTPNNARITPNNGFMWSDFNCSDESDRPMPIRESARGAGLEYGKHATNALLQVWRQPLYAVRSIFRAHQHTGQMEQRILNKDGKSHPDDTGIGKLWEANPRAGHIDGVSVITFAVSPRSGYGYPYDAFGLLSIHEGFDKWRIRVIKNPL